MDRPAVPAFMVTESQRFVAEESQRHLAWERCASRVVETIERVLP
jgi:hypothetical protein